MEDGNTSTSKAKDDTQLAINNSIYTAKLKELIKEVVKDQVKTPAQFSYTYAKPYTQRIDMLKMPSNYQPPKF